MLQAFQGTFPGFLFYQRETSYPFRKIFITLLFIGLEELKGTARSQKPGCWHVLPTLVLHAEDGFPMHFSIMKPNFGKNKTKKKSKKAKAKTKDGAPDGGDVVMETAPGAAAAAVSSRATVSERILNTNIE